MTLPDLGDSSIALDMLLGIERRIFLQQRLRPDERSNAHLLRVSALFFGKWNSNEWTTKAGGIEVGG